MKRVLCSQLPRPGRPAPLPPAEADHVVRVLRLGDGDLLEAMDGQGRSALVTLRVPGAGGPFLEHRSEPREGLQASTKTGLPREPAAVPPIILEAAVLKSGAMEWMVEKSVELGVQALIPTLTAHTVVQVKGKGPEAFRDRWQKIADQALKQCGRLERMAIGAPRKLDERLALAPSKPGEPRLWCDEASRSDAPYLMSWLKDRWLNEEGGLSSFREIRILIGPEGGWSDEERKMLSAICRQEPAALHRLGLGPWTLRGETAAIFASSLVIATVRGNITP